MIDTIGVGIPLTEKQFNKIQSLVKSTDQWSWGKVNLCRLEHSDDPRDFIHMARVKSVAKLRRDSWERDLAWSIPDRFVEGETQLQTEISLPKLYYRGQNIYLLYEPMKGLLLLKKLLEKQLSVRLPDPMTWQPLRADIAYAWRCPTHDVATRLMESLKQLKFPWKDPRVYDTGIYFPGKTYTVKVYLKLEDFIKHDEKNLLKQADSLPTDKLQQRMRNYIHTMKGTAAGVIRFEVELHRRYLREHNFKTLEHLLSPVLQIEIDEQIESPSLGGGLDDWFPIMMISLHHLWSNGGGDIRDIWKTSLDGTRIEAPKDFCKNPEFSTFLDLRMVHIAADMKHRVLGFNQEIDELCKQKLVYHHPGGGYTIRHRNRLQLLLSQMWRKFIGQEVAVTDDEKVEAKLLETYPRQSATRLMGFWRYLRDKGAVRAKEFYGKDSYYRYLRELEAAGVSRATTRVVDVDQEFLDKFTWSIPSVFAVNHQDLEIDAADRIFNQPVIPGVLN